MTFSQHSQAPVNAQEAWINTAHGRIFIKRWTPVASNHAAPLVLFHDSLGCIALWRDFPERLAMGTGRTVIAYDRLGFGRSDPYPGDLPRCFIRDEAGGCFSTLRQQLGFEHFVAFGHSVGGAMAVVCAAKFPAHCQSLITESAQAFVEDRTVEGILHAKRIFEQKGQFDRLEKYHGYKASWVLRSWIDTWLAPDFSGWNLDADLLRVRCPTLVIHGDQDEYGSLQHPERIKTLTGGPATVAILPGCGHVPHREKPEAVIQAVQLFLSSDCQ